MMDDYPSRTPPEAVDPSPERRPSHLPRTPWWLVALTLAALAGVIVVQQFDIFGKGPGPIERAEQDAKGEVVATAEPSPVTIFTKLAMGLQKLAQQDPAAAAQSAGQFAKMIDDQARSLPSATERLHAAIAVAELQGPAAGLQRLDWLQGREPYPAPTGLEAVFAKAGDAPPAVKEGSIIDEDAELVRGLLELYDSSDETLARDPSSLLTNEQRSGFIGRHGLYAELALSLGDAEAPARAKARTDGLKLMGLLIVFGVYFVVAFLTGLVLLVVLCLMAGNGRLRRKFEPGPIADARELAAAADGPPAKPVWLETACLFMVSFLLFSVGSSLLLSGPRRMWVALGLQTCSALIIGWPMLRGYSFARWRREIGLAAPPSARRPGERGSVFKEIGMGLIFYYAGVPVLVFVALLAIVVMVLKDLVMESIFGVKPSPLPTNEVGEILAHGSVGLVVAIFLLAVVWAPIVEESIFRGALFRHLRSRRWGAVASVLLTACAFSLMHGYPLVGLIVVGFLGALFAVMREFRNSIIPSMTAHLLHNFTALVMILMLLHWAGQ